MTEPIDLTPRADALPRSTGRSLRLWLIGAVIVAGGGALLYQMLTQATVYFYNVDEAVAQRADIGDRRVRVQGHVIEDSIEERGDGLAFTMAFGGATLDVVSSTPPPDLFQPDIPVVVEGEFARDEFRSDNILVMHDAEYEEKNDDRVRRAEEDIERTASTTTVAP